MRERALGMTFADEEVVRLYALRPGYPPETIETLTLLIVEPRTVLDAGCGRGELARALVAAARRVDAVDPSVAMMDAGRRLLHGDDARLRWILARAEDAPFDPPYGLIVCGSSLHWMDLDIVLPRFRDALAPGARLAIVDADSRRPGGTIGEELLGLIRRYSPLRTTGEWLREIVVSGRFLVEGEAHSAALAIDQPPEEYLAELGSTSTLSRVTLGDRFEGFRADFRALFAGQALVRREVVGHVIWGRPA